MVPELAIAVVSTPSPMDLFACQQLLEQYEEAILALEAQLPQPEATTILEVLTCRDRLAQWWSKVDDPPREMLNRLIDLDRQIKDYRETIAAAPDLSAWRTILDPDPKAWWWQFQPTPKIDPWERFNWLWSLLTVPVLAANFSLVTKISSQFLAMGLDGLGAFAVVGQSSLALIAAGSTFSKKGGETVEKILASFNLPKRFQNGFKLAISLGVFFTLSSLNRSLNDIAKIYIEKGKELQRQNQAIAALHSYERAIALNNNASEGYFRLGQIYEDLLDLKKAEEYYRLGILSGSLEAHSNLARLYILNGKYEEAASFLNQALLMTKSGDQIIQYFLLKNLGWARLEQKNYGAAITHLQQAIGINDQIGSAHCLLAQAFEGLGEKNSALKAWQDCLSYADGNVQEEDGWIKMAQQRLASAPGPTP